MIILDLQSRMPIYEQLKSQITKLILTDVLKPDNQLPSVRSFAKELGINPNTVQKAYQDLEKDGLVYTVTGKGNYVSSNPNLRSMLIEEEKKAFHQSSVNAKSVGIKKKDALDIINAAYDEEGEKV